jgi:hypothetical protein
MVVQEVAVVVAATLPRCIDQPILAAADTADPKLNNVV